MGAAPPLSGAVRRTPVAGSVGRRAVRWPRHISGSAPGRPAVPLAAPEARFAEAVRDLISDSPDKYSGSRCFGATEWPTADRCRAVEKALDAGTGEWPENVTADLVGLGWFVMVQAGVFARGEAQPGQTDGSGPARDEPGGHTARSLGGRWPWNHEARAMVAYNLGMQGGRGAQSIICHPFQKEWTASQAALLCDLAISVGWENAVSAVFCGEDCSLSETQIRVCADLGPRLGWSRAARVAGRPHKRSSRLAVMIAMGAQAAADLSACLNQPAAADRPADRMREFA